MPLKDVDLAKDIQPIDWLVPGLIPRGFLTILGSLPGAGKTAVVSALAWQLSRPKGVFLGRELDQTFSVYADFDAPSDGRGFRLWIERHRAKYRNGSLKKIKLLEPDGQTYGLGDSELESLKGIVENNSAGLVVIDSFMSAFGGVDPNRLEKVMTPLWYLRQLAHETQAAVVLIDHLPKPLSGEKAGARGILGSQAKQAQARAVHVLTRVPGEEKHILRWESTKLSFGVLPPPFGVELDFSRGFELREVELPESDTRTGQAVRLVQSYLESRAGEVVPRADLVRLITERFNLSKRSRDAAISAALERLGSVEKVKLPGQGHPVGYRLDIGIPVSETEQTTSQTDNVLDTTEVSNGSQVSKTPHKLSDQELLKRAWHLLERLGLPELERQNWSVRLNRQREAAAVELLDRFGGKHVLHQ